MEATVTQLRPEEELESKALAIPEKAQIIVVASKTDMERADTFVKDVKAIVKEIDATFEPLAKKAFESHRAITGRWNEMKKPLDEAVKVVTNKVRAYIAEEQRKAREEEERLREIARKEEEERRLAEAAQLELEGRPQEAMEVIEEPMMIVTPTVKADVPKYDARTYRPPTPKARVINMAKFIAWVAQSVDRYEYITINEQALNRKAKSLGKAVVQAVPGTEYYEV